MATRLIDIHAHFLTDDYRKAMAEAGVKTIDGFPVPAWDVSKALDDMDSSGIETAMLSISAPGIEFVPSSAARALARKVNEEQASFVSDHPRRFGGLALLPLPDIDGALQELEYALETLKLDGVVLFSNISGIYLGDKRLDPIFAELHRRKTVVFVHPVAPPGFDIASLGFPAPALEFPFETARMMMNIIASGTVRRYPEVRMIVAHGGGAASVLAPRISRNLVRFGQLSPALTAEEVSAAFSWFYYDMAAVSHSNAIDAVLAVAPTTRLLFGSDHPFILQNVISEGIQFILSSNKINEATRARLCNENARELFPRLNKIDRGVSSGISERGDSVFTGPRAGADQAAM